MKPTSIRPLIAACLLIGSAGLSSAAMAAGTAHDHGHAAAAKPLPAGQRWASDAALREGMGKIRGALAARLEAIHEDKLGDDHYRSLAETTQQQMAYIVSHCKLAPEADAALHGILARIGEGADAMAGRSAARPREGAVLVAEALDAYGRTFDHPGWKPLH